jgi:hypothetical protein
MKTAMQELIDEMCSINWHLYSFNDKMKVVNVYLEKEKEQIMDAYSNGSNDRLHNRINDYYNQTFNQTNKPMKTENESVNLVPENSIYFTLKNQVEPIMKISNGKFYWKEEEIDDIHNVYEKFNEWLTKANQNK